MIRNSRDIRPKRLKDIDTGHQMMRIQFVLQAGVPVFLVVVPVLVGLLHLPWIQAAAIGVGVTVLVLWLGWKLVARFGDVTNELLMPSGVPAARTYAEQDAAVAGGRYAEAADLYRAIGEEEPANSEVRFRLASLLRDHCGDDRGAEALLIEMRSLPLTPQQDSAVAERLIDLYQGSGERAKLMAELRRFVGRYRNTAAGVSAARYLGELQQEG
jgi:hypothetical protein